MEADQEGEPRLFDEYNDDDDDGFFYGGFGGKNDGLRVVLVAPDRSPAVPAAATGQCCGKKKSAAEGSEAVAAAGADNTAEELPAPVLVTGWAGAGVVKCWQTRGDSREGEREETASVAVASGRGTAAADGERRGGTEVGEVVRASRGIDTGSLFGHTRGEANLLRGCGEIIIVGRNQQRFARD